MRIRQNLNCTVEILEGKEGSPPKNRSSSISDIWSVVKIARKRRRRKKIEP